MIEVNVRSAHLKLMRADSSSRMHLTPRARAAYNGIVIVPTNTDDQLEAE